MKHGEMISTFTWSLRFLDPALSLALGTEKDCELIWSGKASEGIVECLAQSLTVNI